MMDFFSYIADFFSTIWNFITNFFEMAGYLLEMAFSALSLPSVFISGYFPPILGSMFIFVILIAVVKLIITLGGYSE